jgi:citrate lyase beta subunit
VRLRFRAASVLLLAPLASCLVQADDQDARGMPADEAVTVAYAKCSGTYVTLVDDDHTLIVDLEEAVTDPQINQGLDQFHCVLDTLDTSERLTSRIMTTTAAMGTQHTSEAGLDYVWAYHPVDGIYLSVTEGRDSP